MKDHDNQTDRFGFQNDNPEARERNARQIEKEQIETEWKQPLKPDKKSGDDDQDGKLFGQDKLYNSSQKEKER